jgi:hypothetical protein
VNRRYAFGFVRGAVHVGHGHAAKAELRNERSIVPKAYGLQVCVYLL